MSLGRCSIDIGEVEKEGNAPVSFQCGGFVRFSATSISTLRRNIILKPRIDNTSCSLRSDLDVN